MADVFFYIIVFIFGLIIGSFLNCLIYRLEQGQGFVKGRSFCPNCHHTLFWQDLIPVLSFIFLKGKCRYCSQKISLQYPLVELASGIIFLLIFLEFGVWNSLFYWLIAGSLIVIFVYDLKHYIIPDKIVYPAITIAFLYRFFEIWNLGHWNLFGNWKLEIGNLEPLTLSLLSGAGAAAFFLSIVLISQGRWMGAGDIKLAFLMGLILGFPNILPALFLAFFIGALAGLILVFSNKKTLKSEIPFGPFLIAGTLLALFWGSQIINWYQGLFLLSFQ